MKKKQNNRRSRVKYPALDPKLNLKTRNHLIESSEYLNKLPESWTDPKTGKVWSNHDLKQFLNDFNTEYINADFKTNVAEGRKRIHKKKRAEHPKNKHLKKLLADFLNHIKTLVALLNRSQITNTNRSKLKKSVNKFKKQLKAQIKKEFKFIEDKYKSDAEHANNHRNSCILTKQKAMGTLKSIEELPTTLMRKNDLEDEIIENIDAKRLGILNDED